MGNEKTQPTLIDKQVYEQFKRYVKDVHGHTHGHLKTELENALRDYMQSDNGEARMARMENDIATLITMLDEANLNAEADGGNTPQSNSQGQYTRPRDSNKPKANAPRKDKIDYLISRLVDEMGVKIDSGELPTSEFKKIIKSEYGFKADTINEYQERMIDELDAVENPRHGQTVVWGERYEQIVDELREEAEREMDEL
jgi:hypothetical protein